MTPLHDELKALAEKKSLLAIGQFVSANLPQILAALAARIEALELAGKAAETWLRECSTWLLTNDLDMQCPLEADPLDIADDLARATLKGNHDEQG